MGSGRAATRTLPKINSETNLAVQLLLAVSDGRTCKPHLRSGPDPIRSSPIPSPWDSRNDASEDSDATQCVTPSSASPALIHKTTPSVSGSPKGVPPTLSRNDATFFKYTREERQEALQRFREKKRRRQFHKRVRYMVRKRLAETRPRYKGRFSKPPPGENYDDGTPGPPAVSSQSDTKEHPSTKQLQVKV